MVVIIDYGIGNVGSIQNMLLKIGVNSEVSSHLGKIRDAHKLILPGVGHFDVGMSKLNEYNLIETLNNRVVANGVPILGICLGMQLMTQSSEEGLGEGLKWITATAKKFTVTEGSRLRVPHMGWNTLSPVSDHVLFNNLGEGARFYFVHSYYVQCSDEAQSLAKTGYGIEFDSAVKKDNIFGVQFHPEKSHKFGKEVLQNFINFKD